MALKKARTIAGFTAEYWHIADFAYSKERSNTVVVLNNYKDKETREAGLENKFDGSVIFNVEPDAEVLNAFLAHLYEKAKTADTQYDERVDTGEVDEEGKPIIQVTHYFSDALDA